MMPWRFQLLTLLLCISVNSLFAADKRLAPGHVPAAVARGSARPLGRVPSTRQVRLALSLPLRDRAGLTNFLASLYNPGSPTYRHYLTPREFTDRFGPTLADYAAVEDFARTNHLEIVATHSNRLLLDVAGRAADVERAFHVKLHTFKNPKDGRTCFAPDTEPTVDARVPLLDVSGLTDFSLPHPNSILRRPGDSARRKPQGGSSPTGTYMGNDFRQAYVPGTSLTGAGQSVALLQFDAFHPEDITNYANAIGLSNNVPTVTVVAVNGGVAYPSTGSSEVTLDIDMILAMAPGISNIYVYEAPNPSPWMDILAQMANDDLAAQLSCSWSGGGEDAASEQIFQQMAAQGQSFFNAAGDSGAYTNLAPFPCASPNITEVGGTFLNTDTNGNYLQEVVWNSGQGYASGGGIGFLVPTPPWQQGLNVATNGGSTVWRNVPDVALTADEVYIIFDGQPWDETGTSCAAPLWAGFMALVNQQAAELAQPPVGFLNPALYSLCQGTNYAQTFHDITVGNNTNYNSPFDFVAAPGYDLCTGWGTPTGTNLINALLMPNALGILTPAFYSLSAPVGGPFPQTNWLITLTNSGPVDLDWSLAGLPDWLAASVTNGTLAPSNSLDISLQWVDPTNAVAGIYRATLSITNVAVSGVQHVVIQLELRHSLVDNGGFETGDFSGWTLVGDTVTRRAIYNVVASQWNFPNVVHSGNFGAFLGESGYAATLSQTLNTVPGQFYVVSWWLNNPIFGGGQSFVASWDGANYVDLESPDAFGWTNFEFGVTATDTNALLQFAAENDINYFGLDDVTVMAVPPVVFTNYWMDSNGLVLSWPSRSDLNYLVQYSTNLSDGVWENLCQMAGGTNGTTCSDTNILNGDAQRFYRLILLP